MRKFWFKPALQNDPDGGFLFFVQSLDEQLYDLADDSYKAPALNTFTRTLELQGLAKINHAAGLPKEALLPFIEELEWSISEDAVLSSQQKAICRSHLKAVRDSVSKPDRLAKSLAGLRLSLGDYFTSIKSQIRDCIKNTPTHKEELSALAAAFVVQAELLKFPRRHSYHVLQNFIIKPLSRPSTTDYIPLLDDFFAQFLVTPQEYYCIFIASNSVTKFPNLLAQYGIEVMPEPINLLNLSRTQEGFIATKAADQVFIKLKKIEASNPVDAHESAVMRFREYASVVRYVEHELDDGISKLSLVVKVDGERRYVIRDIRDPMHCWSALHQGGEPEMLRLVDVFHGDHLTPESRYRLRKAIRYHGIALRSSSPETQLVDIWAGLEGLLAQPPKDDTRINFFAESLLPALTLTYPEKLLQGLYQKLNKYPKILDEIDQNVSCGANPFSKFVYFLLSADYQHLRVKVLPLMAESPLLINRAWRVAQSLEKPDAILKTLKTHRKKLRWHIERIYSSRNSIMHNASALPYVPTLVENLHTYFDALVASIVKVSTVAQEQISIESVLQYLSAWEHHRFESLSNSTTPHMQVTNSNVWNITFGDDFVLAPSK